MNKTDLLLQMMQQPQSYSDDEWQEILADDECRELYTMMSKMQSAIDAARADEEITDEVIDAEWQRLNAQTHFSPSISRFPRFLKFAAMFVGILMLSGIAYAAIHWWVSPSPSKGKDGVTATTDTIVECKHSSLFLGEQKKAPKLYDNVPIEQILSELSDIYHIQVAYRSDTIRRLRLFYQWRPEYTIEKVVEMLNNFEALHLILQNDTLIVSSTVEQQP